MHNLPPLSAPLQKFGRIPDMDAGGTNEEVWDGEGAYSWAAAAESLTISSSSTDDTSAGTGAKTVTLYGLNSAGEEVALPVTLNGQTGVAIPTDLKRVYRAYVTTAGTGGVNAGNIWIGKGSITAGVPATKYAGILAGLGQTLMAIYCIPVKLADGTPLTGGRIVRWYGTCGAGQAAYATIALQTRASGGAWRTRRMAGIGEGGWMNDALAWGIDLDCQTDIRIRVISNGVNNSTIEAGFDVALRQDVAG